jgi:hypothetical protein
MMILHNTEQNNTEQDNIGQEKVVSERDNIFYIRK